MTRAGPRCSRSATDGPYCVAHTPNPEKSITKHLVPGPHPGAGRQRRPREIELIQEVAEERKAELRAVYVDGLVATKAVVVGNGPTAHLEIEPDYPHRHKVAESMLDRLHGKPTQSIENTGAADVTVNIALVTDRELRADAADIRRRLAADRSVKPSWPDAGD